MSEKNTVIAVSEEYMVAVRLTNEKVTIHELINFDKEPISPVKVSIVVPVCNVEQYLRECLDSCINQTLREIEIICVNDGSTDNCLNILKEYAAADDRVKIISKDNAGYGHTMNIGMDMAKGEYIGIVESDDFVEPDMYEELYRTVKENEVDWVKADFKRVFDIDGKYEYKYVKTARNNYMYNRIIENIPNDKYYFETFRSIMNTWSGIYKREFIVKNVIRHNETPGASFQDNGFYFKTVCHAEKLLFINKPFYCYRMDNPNSSSNNKGKVDAAKIEYNLLKNYIKEKNLNEFLTGMYYWRKYNSFIYHYSRIADEYKKEYLISVSQEFKQDLSSGQIDPNLFFSHELDEFEWIADNPEDYYAQHCTDSIKVSVIIPVYNAEEHLAQCLDTVLEQTLKEIEIICVDDGSDDSSLDILNEYAAKEPRMIILTQENAGAGAARNKGLSIAKGEYLSFLDADDFFEPEMLESIYNKCKKTHADIGVFKVKNYYDVSQRIVSDKNSFVEQNIPRKEVFSPLEMQDKIFTTFQTWAWNKLFRKHFIEKERIQFQPIHRTNDMYFTNVALMLAKRITALPQELVFYRREGTSNCQSTNHLYPTDFFTALLAVQKRMWQIDGNQKFTRSFVNLVVKSCIYNLNSLSDADGFVVLYNFLHNKGFQPDSIDISSFNINDIYKENQSAYEECLKIYTQTYEQYMFEKLIYHRRKIKSLEDRSSKLNREMDNLKRKNTMEIKFADIDVLQRQNEALIREEFSMLKNVMQEAEEYKTQLLLTRASFSFKLGSLITWLPRKIRGLFRKR